MTKALTAERLRELLHYDPKSGIFTRLVKRTTGSRGWVARTGYLQICVDGRTYAAHRLVWLFSTGEWPAADVDHIDGDKLNNRFANLRDAPTCINMQNERRARRNNKSGLMGAVFRKERQRWTATVVINGKRRRFGSFATAQEAHEAYVVAKRLNHPGFTL